MSVCDAIRKLFKIFGRVGAVKTGILLRDRVILISIAWAVNEFVPITLRLCALAGDPFTDGNLNFARSRTDAKL